MNSPGAYSLGDIAITASAVYVGPWITDLDGMAALSAQVAFLYGSGGISLTAFLQTSFDQGVTSVDMAAVAFTTASGVAVFNLSGLTPRLAPYTPTDGALAPGNAIDGLLGDRIRIKIASVGTYAGSTVLSGRVVAR